MGMNLYRGIKKLLLTAALWGTLLAGLTPGWAFAAQPWPEDVSVSAEGACVMDADSMTVLYGKNQDTAYFPASITKVMTALLVLENCPDLSETVTFSQEAVELGEDNATIIGASAGDQLSVEDCLYSMLFKSANEVANALAEHVGAKFPELKENGMSDRDVFIGMMNRRAAELGCTNTHFNNPSGLTDPNHYTTAYDMCLILAAAIRNDRFVDIESRTYWTHAPIRRYPDPEDPWNTVYASHRMLRKNSSYYYPGVFAGKTGYTMTAGNTLVTACRKDGMTLVVTVLNGHQTHYEDTKRLLDFGYDNFHSLPVTEFDTAYEGLREDLSVGGRPVMDITALAVDEDSSVVLPKDEDVSSLQSSLSFDMTEADPQDAAAKVSYTYEGRQVGSAYLRSRTQAVGDRLAEEETDPLFLSLTGGLPETVPESGAKGTAPEESPGTAAAPETTLTPAETAGTETLAAAGETEASEAAEDGMVRIFGLAVPAAVMKLLKVAAVICCLLLLGALWMFHQEKKEAMQRARRRQRRLKHTRDLTGQQNITLDLMVEQRMRKKSRRRRRR